MVAAATLALVLRADAVGIYEVAGPSMLPTLESGDSIAGNKLAYSSLFPRAPRRGEVVVLRAAAAPAVTAKFPEFLVKRVVGLPGDRVGMTDDGVPVINGWTVPTCPVGDYFYLPPAGFGDALGGQLHVEFLDDANYLALTIPNAPRFSETYTVGPGEVFVLGDDRAASVDSRAWNEGRGAGVPFGAIDARAQWVLAGTHRDGAPDFSHPLGPLFSRHVHLEGLDTRALDEAIQGCLKDRPTETRPPSAGART
jgi:signal peptidase I